MKQILSLILLAAGSLLLCSCQKSDEFTVNPYENFESLWKIMDENYCFFEYKDVDWDEIHDKYYSQLTDSINQYALFDLMGNMLAELKDGHTNLYSSFDMARYWDWYTEYPPNFYDDLNEDYLGKDYKIAAGLKYKKTADDKIGYIRCESFSRGFGETNLDYVMLHFKSCKALIIDIRDNGGGSLMYSERLASRFAKEKMLTGYIQHKTGRGHNDFSNPHPVYLDPSEHIRWLRPVVILTNRHCYSAANDFVQTMKLLPHVTIIGDRTGGGSGFPFSSELPNGWSVRFSACPMLDADKQITEFGIDPDVKVEITKEDLLRGVDTIIEYAIKYLQEKMDESK